MTRLLFSPYHTFPRRAKKKRKKKKKTYPEYRANSPPTHFSLPLPFYRPPTCANKFPQRAPYTHTHIYTHTIPSPGFKPASSMRQLSSLFTASPPEAERGTGDENSTLPRAGERGWGRGMVSPIEGLSPSARSKLPAE